MGMKKRKKSNSREILIELLRLLVVAWPLIELLTKYLIGIR